MPRSSEGVVVVRFLIDERDIEPEESLALHRAILSWAAPRSDRFILGLNEQHYTDRSDLERLLALGNAEASPPPGGLRSRLSRVLPGLSPGSLIRVVGMPGPTFVEELTRSGAPPGAVAGDVSPAEDVELFRGDRMLYGSYDYGRTQILDLVEDEVDALRSTLLKSGLPADRMVPAPPYVTG